MNGGSFTVRHTMKGDLFMKLIGKWEVTEVLSVQDYTEGT